MTTRRISTQRLDKEIANVVVPLKVNQVPPLEEASNDDQALVIL